MQLNHPPPATSAPSNGANAVPMQLPDLRDAMNAQPLRQYLEFDTPDSMPLEMRTVLLTGLGRCAVSRITMKLLSSFEQRRVYQQAAQFGDQMIALTEAQEALAFALVAPIQPTPVMVARPDGTRFEEIHDLPNPNAAIELALMMGDGTAEGFFAGLHMAMRKLVLVGYASATSPDDKSAISFMASRRTVTR